MSSPVRTGFPLFPLLLLSGAIFVSVTSEFLPTGLLPDMAEDLGVSESRVGLLVTVFAATVVISTAPLAVVTRRFSRKWLMVALLLAFALSNVFAAIAPTYELLVAARIVGGVDAGTLVGTSSLADFDETNEHAHIGWTAWSPRVWGTAVNPEAKLLMLSEAFNNGFGRIKLQADEVNVRSRAAITKLGAQFEGIQRRDRRRADGSWRSTAIYSILRDEWPVVRETLESRLSAFSTPITL